jgi:hypothetical protein
VPLLHLLGDCHQLPPVGRKCHFNDSPPTGEPQEADSLGKAAFQLFWNPPADPTQEIAVAVAMDETTRQTDPRHKKFIHELRQGSLSRESAELLMSRRLDQLPPAVQKEFKRHALHAMPAWKGTVPITKERLKSLNQPVARVDAQLSGSRSKDHAKEELNLPVCAALSVDAKVMLLTNFVVEEHLLNGALGGSVIDAVHKDPEGPWKPGNQPACVVANFPKCKVPAQDAWDPANPTHVPIPTVEFCCEKKCCSMKQVPLRVCKAIAACKCQGGTAGPGQVWEK